MQFVLTGKRSTISTLLLSLVLSASAIAAPANGQRFKTLADVMDDIMRTKNADWVKKNLGEPSAIDKQYPGYIVWRWNTTYRDKIGPKTPCSQIFALDMNNKLVGWNTDCLKDTPAEIYGETSATTPIPQPVVPTAIAEIVAKKRAADIAAEEAIRTRPATYADYLASFIGASEEKVYTEHRNIASTDKLANGKVVKTYDGKLRYSNAFGDSSYYYCKYSLSFLGGKVVGYDAGDCYNKDIVPDMNVHYKTPKAPWNAL